MRRFSTFCVLGALGISLIGCRSGPIDIPDHRPGDFRLGVVVMNSDDNAEGTHRDARYLIDTASVLRSSFGSGSSLETYPGFTRRLDHNQMDAIWLMTTNLLESQAGRSEMGSEIMRAGQPQSMIESDSGIIIEVHLNSTDQVFSFDHQNQQAAAIVDALAQLSWIDTVPNRVPDTQSP